MHAQMSEIASMLVTHRKASIDEIERAWHGDVETILKWVGSQDRVEECAVLKTCNRVEIYVVCPRGEKVLFDLAKKARVSSRIIDFHDHDESLLHLFRLASGLESMIMGEDQILGQMKELSRWRPKRERQDGCWRRPSRRPLPWASGYARRRTSMRDPYQ